MSALAEEIRKKELERARGHMNRRSMHYATLRDMPNAMPQQQPPQPLSIEQKLQQAGQDKVAVANVLTQASPAELNKVKDRQFDFSGLDVAKVKDPQGLMKMNGSMQFNFAGAIFANLDMRGLTGQLNAPNATIYNSALDGLNFSGNTHLDHTRIDHSSVQGTNFAGNHSGGMSITNSTRSNYLNLKKTSQDIGLEGTDVSLAKGLETSLDSGPMPHYISSAKDPKLQPSPEAVVALTKGPQPAEPIRSSSYRQAMQRWQVPTYGLG